MQPLQVVVEARHDVLLERQTGRAIADLEKRVAAGLPAAPVAVGSQALAQGGRVCLDRARTKLRDEQSGRMDALERRLCCVEAEHGAKLDVQDKARAAREASFARAAAGSS